MHKERKTKEFPTRILHEKLILIFLLYNGRVINIQKHKSTMTVKTMQTNHVPCKLSDFKCITFFGL